MSLKSIDEIFLILVEDIKMSESKMNKSEGKYLYTAQLMNQALLKLLEEKELDYITVTEIAKKAGVNRSTFYLHYDNIYELFEETVENLNKEFSGCFLDKKVEFSSQKESFLLTDEYIKPYLMFVKKNKRILRLVYQKPQLFKVEKAYLKMQEKVFNPAIARFDCDKKEMPYKLEFYTRGVSAIVKKWLEMDCSLDENELIAIIKDCVGYDIK